MAETDSQRSSYSTSKKADHVSDEEDSSDDGDLGLEGVLVRNPEALTSTSSSDSDEGTDKDDKPTNSLTVVVEKSYVSKRPLQDLKPSQKGKRKKHKKTSSSPEVDMVHVEFTFHDMNQDFFHGVKTLLHNSSIVYQPFSSELSDIMIQNISVGTLISTEGDTENNVFGFASVLNIQTYKSCPAIQYLSKICTKCCPAEHLEELDTVLSGKTNRPVGFLLHGRMINLPMEIVLALHQQLVLDIDWAVDNAEGGPNERKSLDFGAFVRIAPCQACGSDVIFRYFDDEIFGNRAWMTFTVDAPKSYSSEESLKLQIMMLTKTGHRQAMEDLVRLVHGGSSQR